MNVASCDWCGKDIEVPDSYRIVKDGPVVCEDCEFEGEES